ncbi:ribonuclease P protein component [Wolbachia endosymbiont of Dirofilaria (Dirofilaria) immitis]|uniref:ribonuclease P protein component n=1 Tax=Wolbachia endosymbiont of Dirofilaria (Dirofilaria) immitis TaxID=1812115 RepID=UPI00158B37F0|nr:ribonuclease P protein component [Wolbachia endosymbiont of Dirofilaria (Dirofilaria) immitis]QKX02095.1 ribonuclease P protein component [Wolbachia endosymbiont of Dirofilaria (Dirofilaria) immitis]
MHSEAIKYKKKDFSFAFKNKLAPSSFFYHGFYISLYTIKEREPEKYIYTIRAGLVISKKVGKATKRNKIKRRLRMLIRMNILNASNTGYYYIIITHRNIVQASYKNLQKDLTFCFKKIK